jgi:hypothetical protein
MPDWTHSGTGKQIETYLGNDFKFNGPGVYLTATDTLLIVPDVEFPPPGTQQAQDFLPWRHRWPEETRFKIYMFGCPFEFTIMAAQLPIPTRQERPE